MFIFLIIFSFVQKIEREILKLHLEPLASAHLTEMKR